MLFMGDGLFDICLLFCEFFVSKVILSVVGQGEEEEHYHGACSACQ